MSSTELDHAIDRLFKYQAATEWHREKVAEALTTLLTLLGPPRIATAREAAVAILTYRDGYVGYMTSSAKAALNEGIPILRKCARLADVPFIKAYI